MKKLIFLLAGVFMFTGVLAQKKVGGVVMPPKVEVQGQNLLLNGAGVREKLWIDLYAAGLYLDQKKSSAPAILDGEQPMMIKLHILSKLITSDKMVEAVTEGFEKATNGNTAPIQDEIDSIISFFREDIQKNDVFDLVYVPAKGVVAYKNGQEKGVVQGKDFKKALFGIWLSNRPADDSLRDELLGR